MPRQPWRPPELVGQIFQGSTALRHKLLTAHQLRSSAWRRLHRDVHCDNRLTQDHGLRCRAAALTMPAGAVIAGRSAAYLWGVDHAAGFAEPVEIIIGSTSPWMPQQSIRLHSTDLRTDDIATHAASDLRLTTASRTAWDLAAWVNVVDAVSTIDGLLGAGLVTPGQLAEFAIGRAGRRGSVRAKRAFELADGRAQSRPESRLRVNLVLDGFPIPEVQHPVPVSGRLLHPDLAWPEYKVAVEYDGEWHDNSGQFHLDRRRLNLLVTEGWIVLHVTSRRLRDDLDGVKRELRKSLVSRGWTGSSRA